MGLFKRKEVTTVQLSQRQVLENTIKVSRNNILLVLVFSIVNILLLVTNSNTYFLFSAFVPYALADVGMLMTGKYPAEYYGEELSEWTFLDDSFLAIMLGIAAVTLILYALCWVFAKNKPAGWMTFALVLFSIDTALLLLMQGIALGMILDYVFHAWVIVSFAKGISAVKKLKNLPEEETVPEAEPVALTESEEETAAPVEE